MLEKHEFGRNKSKFEHKNKIHNRRTPSIWIKIETKNKLISMNFLNYVRLWAQKFALKRKNFIIMNNTLGQNYVTKSIIWLKQVQFWAQNNAK